jgi:HAD superfamily hydrolase (TIGR01549 family)
VAVRAVTFGFRVTLFEPENPARLRALTAKRSHMVHDALAAAGEGAAGSLDQALRMASGPPEQVYRALAQAGAAQGVDLGELHIDRGVIQRLQRALDDLAREMRWRRAPGSAAVLRHLRQRGYKLGLIANTGWPSGRVVREVLAADGMLMYFQAFSLADEVGVRKPDPAIFRHALFHLDEEANPATVVHVGASSQNDVAGAAAVGLGTIRYTGFVDDAGPAVADAKLGDFRDLPALIHAWSGRTADSRVS